MKDTVRLLFALFVVVVFTGCYKQIPKEAVIPVEVRVVDLDVPLPSKDEADVVVITHIKKVSYLFSPRTAETPYTFILSINGKEIKDTLKGVEDVESKIDAERGEGIHYALKKRLRLKPGKYEIILKSEDGKSAKIKTELKGGKLHGLRFEPVYGPPKFGRPKHFREGVVYYDIYLDE
ncbi:MAG: hypothetical protein HZA00_05880 [Nitrospinae bacterium]|nr:hypothetical protein [Nitrospinota bacterium]